MSEQDYPLPPATFEFLVLSLRTQAEMHLGLLFVGEKDRPEPDFRIARHSIDLLAMLQDKTRGNTTVEEQRLIENTVTELRFRYVQAMQQQQQKPETPTPVPEPAKTGRTSDLMEAEEKAENTSEGQGSA